MKAKLLALRDKKTNRLLNVGMTIDGLKWSTDKGKYVFYNKPTIQQRGNKLEIFGKRNENIKIVEYKPYKAFNVEGNDKKEFIENEVKFYKKAYLLSK